MPEHSGVRYALLLSFDRCHSGKALLPALPAGFAFPSGDGGADQASDEENKFCLYQKTSANKVLSRLSSSVTASRDTFPAGEGKARRQGRKKGFA